MWEFFTDLFIDELFGILPKPLRMLLWAMMGAGVIGLIVWLVMR